MEIPVGAFPVSMTVGQVRKLGGTLYLPLGAWAAQQSQPVTTRRWSSDNLPCNMLFGMAIQRKPHYWLELVVVFYL